MKATEWISLASALAWPAVAIGALIYIWRSDAIGKLIRISDAVKDLNKKLSDLVEAEQSLRALSETFSEVTLSLNQVQSDILEMKADVENINDKVEHRAELPDLAIMPGVDDKVKRQSLEDMFEQMEGAWQALVKALQDRFGYFDARSVGVAARGFARRNRRGEKLEYDQAEEIARLQSSIKSYRRRQGYLNDWLDPETRDAFVGRCDHMRQAVLGTQSS